MRISGCRSGADCSGSNERCLRGVAVEIETLMRLISSNLMIGDRSSCISNNGSRM